MNKRALVVLSGGMDSSVTAHLLRHQGYSLDALWFDYGQRHKRERESAEQIAAGLGIRLDTVDVSGYGRLLQGNALTDGVAVPEGHYADESMKLTVVPMRNTIFLAMACGVAMSRGIEMVAIGVHAGDHPIYPDCRPAFINNFQTLLDGVVADNPVSIYAPFLRQTKADIVAVGARLGVPFGDTWSCYKGGALHCGKCGTCAERKEAFALAGVSDPTRYAECM